MNKKYIFIFIVFLVGIFFILAFRGALQKIQEKRNSVAFGQIVFENILLTPIPSGVKNIEQILIESGSKESYLKFVASPDVIARILALHEYKKRDCSERTVFQTLYSLPTEKKQRKWNIEKTSEASVCYTTLIFNETGIEGKFYSNTVRQRARSEFLFDEQTGVVYFHEQGI